jgi:uncharacterized membrane protein YbhN (UPF0104 family)
MRSAVVKTRGALGSLIRIRPAAGLLLFVAATACLLLLLPEQALAAHVRDGVRSGIGGLGDADPLWLVVVGTLLACSLSGSALAWRASLRACGTCCSPVDAVARYGIGSLANAVLPAKLGGVIRIGLFSRLVAREGAVWTTGGAAAVVGIARSLWLAGLVAAASTTGVLPTWPAFALVGAACVGICVALVARRTRWHARAAHVLDAFRAVARRPRAALVVVLCVGVAVGARVAAACTLALAFGVERPLAAGLLVIAAIELAAVLPISPGSAGTAAAAVAFALAAHGVGGKLAFSAGLAFAAVETSTSVVIGTLGALFLAAPAVARRLGGVAAPEPAPAVVPVRD